MNDLQLKLLTRRLLEKCGGPKLASEALKELGVRESYSEQQLYRCQTPETQAGAPRCFLPLDVIAALEGYCGEPVISRALFEASPASAQVASALTEAAEALEAMADAHKVVRLSVADGKFTPRETAETLKAIAQVREQLNELVAAVEREAV